jgi:AAA+ superfamily predicted ATPase
MSVEEIHNPIPQYKGEQNSWHERNKNALLAALAAVRDALQRHAVSTGAKPDEAELLLNESPCEISTEDMEHSALQTLCTTFDLSPFERDIMVLCAGIELDDSIARLCATAQGDASRSYPTFSLALAALPYSHWSALAPDAPLRHWRLIEIVPSNSVSGLTSSPLRIDERILHYLTGIHYFDERLAGIVQPFSVSTGHDTLTPSHRAIAERLAALWSNATQQASVMPVIQLCGDEIVSKRAIAATTCDMLHLNLALLSAHSLPNIPHEFETLRRLWQREAVLSNCAILLDCDDVDATDSVCERNITHFLESTSAAVIVSSSERRRAIQRPVVTFEVEQPVKNEQYAVWQHALGTVAPLLNGKVETLVSQFRLDSISIEAVSAEVLGGVTAEMLQREDFSGEIGQLLWEACRVHARVRLDDLAQRIVSSVEWDDLILPEQQLSVLRDVAMHVRQRAKVYETWGFAAKSSRGLGISALFAGASGTGKTMAAEVLANTLRLDLYRIDLSQIVSKYIGETEKNLRKIFDAAEESGAILLFDEADALFGKRSEVRDSHDRYANIEVSYLLQRMESYRGLAILTTNMKSALDTAFLRRLNFVVQFPFPDAVQRANIWQRIFPANTPIESLDISKLARLNVTGGNIRSIALNAAFLAADINEPVRMTHLLRAARSEYAKLEKSLTDVEIGGWV